METTFQVRTSYKMGGHEVLYGQDVGFYNSLPGYHEECTDTDRVSAVPIPDIYSLLSVVGSAVLSSTVLATAIKAWLHRKSKITIKVTGSQKQVTFEGPNLKYSVPEIQALLEAMQRKEGQIEELNVIAVATDATIMTEAQYEAIYHPGREAGMVGRRPGHQGP